MLKFAWEMPQTFVIMYTKDQPNIVGNMNVANICMNMGRIDTFPCYIHLRIFVN